ncbi:hypothetical protein FRUB_02810 [Fimbriiglobus ruber]|uniref:Uncharacterized protein n=1 Tax=Fimbriiglobus ruber TaxID=1908690 RepID=A0A225DPI4_9BACT|nr:hypothetical protein FRUB_02810 [Fimbriiglobus ruber]
MRRDFPRLPTGRDLYLLVVALRLLAMVIEKSGRRGRLVFTKQPNQPLPASACRGN